MSKKEVMDYISKEFNSTVYPHYQRHLNIYKAKIFPICERGKQQKVTLPWETILSKDKTMFHLQIYGNKYGVDAIVVAEFNWKSQHCFAYIKNKLMIVFSEHSLRRYEERVKGHDMNMSINVKQTFKSLIKMIPLSYRTVLSSRTHQLCYYFVVQNALFLGDYDDNTYLPEQKEGDFWLNTCISLKEAGTTQKGILNTLSLMPLYIKKIGFDPFGIKADSDDTLALRSEPSKWEAVQSLCRSVYLIDKLFCMMNLPVSKETNNCFYTEMKLAGVYLEIGGTDISKLTPYGPNGIAIKGELDYKGN